MATSPCSSSGWEGAAAAAAAAASSSSSSSSSPSDSCSSLAAAASKAGQSLLAAATRRWLPPLEEEEDEEEFLGRGRGARSLSGECGGERGCLGGSAAGIKLACPGVGDEIEKAVEGGRGRGSAEEEEAPAVVAKAAAETTSGGGGGRGAEEDEGRGSRGGLPCCEFEIDALGGGQSVPGTKRREEDVDGAGRGGCCC